MFTKTYNNTKKNSLLFSITVLLIFICNVSFLKAQPGTLDPTFNPGTGANTWVECIALQNDGKILIGGYFTSYNETPINRIARLNSDGSLDQTFNPGTGANQYVSSIVLLNEGKILISGTFTSYNGTPRSRIARLNSDGSLDLTFDPGAGANGEVTSMIVLPGGNLLIGGSFSTFDGRTCRRIARLSGNGSLDTTFNQGEYGFIGLMVFSMAIQSDGKIIIGGDFSFYNNVQTYNLVRIHPDGSKDITFNSGGEGPGGDVRKVAVQTDGKIAIGGDFATYNSTIRWKLARLNSDGTLDNSFLANYGTSWVWDILFQADGRMVVCGDGGLKRFLSNGDLDSAFNTGTNVNDRITGAVLQNDEKIVIAGRFTNYNGTPRKGVARIDAGVTSISQISTEVPNGYSLNQNYPNPFNPQTKIRFTIPAKDFMKLSVYNQAGQEVAQLVNQNLSAGSYEYTFDGSRLTSGVYYYTLRGTNFSETKKMLLIK